MQACRQLWAESEEIPTEESAETASGARQVGDGQGDNVISLGHTDFIQSVAISGDGRRALSSSFDNTLRLWELESGSCIRILEGHSDFITSVALSGDGRRALSGAHDKTLRLWELESGSCICTLEGHSDCVYSVALSGDGRRALSGSADNTLRLWDLENGSCLRTLRGHLGSVHSVAFSGDGRRALSSGSVQNILRLWDLESGSCFRTLIGHVSDVNSVALSGDGRRALSGSEDKTLRLWELESGSCIRTLEGHSGSVNSVALSGDGRRALSGSADNTLRLWDLESGSCIGTLEGHSGYVSSVALSGDGRRALSGSYDETLRLWDLGSGSCIRTLGDRSGYVNSVALSGDDRRALSGSEDKTLRLWELESGSCLRTLEGHSGSVNSVALSGDGRRALSGAHDKTLRLWDLGSGSCLRTLEGHSGSVNSVALSGDGRRALSGSYDETLRLWDLGSGSCLRILEGHSGCVNSVALSGDGRRALSGADDETLRLWDLESGSCLRTLGDRSGYVNSVALSGDGRRALSGSYDNTLRLWELESGSCLRILEGHSGSVNSVALSGDGRRALSGAHDKTLRLWDLGSGSCIRTLEGHSGSVRSVAFQTDASGKLVGAFSAAENGVLRYWSLELDEATSTAITASTPKRYTNAKVLIVGDSGVGKTGLAIRLADNRYEPTDSTDAHWATQLKLNRNINTPDSDREIWLWDFAGQPDYRLTHRLFFNQTALALLVFDPQVDNPFEGLGQWDRSLTQSSSDKDLTKLLVAGRCDRGDLTVTQASIDSFAKERGFLSFHKTSAKDNEGCEELREAIVEAIDWSRIPETTSPAIFKLLKDEILNLRDSNTPLLHLGALKQQLQMRLPEDPFDLATLNTVINLLAGPGIIWPLGFGDYILLKHELINTYAAATIRKVRNSNVSCISVSDLLSSNLDYREANRLPEAEEAIVLRALHKTLIERGICLSQTLHNSEVLIFPTFFNRELPDDPGLPTPYIEYTFTGSLETLYATLIVRLQYTEVFRYHKLWKYAAEYRTPTDKPMGLKATRLQEGSAQLRIHFDPTIPDDTKVTFARFIHNHIHSNANNIRRRRYYACPACGTAVSHQAVTKRLNLNKPDILCNACEEQRILFNDPLEQQLESEPVKQEARDLDRTAQAQLDSESLELLLVGHTKVIAAEAGQIFRETPNSDWGIDGEIEFKDIEGRATGKKLYVQLKSGDSHLRTRKDGSETFTIKNDRHRTYWLQQPCPVMLVIRTTDGSIRWMDLSTHPTEPHPDKDGDRWLPKTLDFRGDPFNAANLLEMRDRLIPTRDR